MDNGVNKTVWREMCKSLRSIVSACNAREGAAFGIGVDREVAVKVFADQVARIMQGEEPHDIRTEHIDGSYTFVINSKAAEKQGLQVSPDLEKLFDNITFI